MAAIGGYWLAHVLDASIAGSMATVVGALFAVALLLAPGRGLVAVARRRARQRFAFAHAMLAIHLLNHEGRPDAAKESRIDHLDSGLRWDPAFAAKVVRQSEQRGLVLRHDGSLALTQQGRKLARESLVRW